MEKLDVIMNCTYCTALYCLKHQVKQILAELQQVQYTPYITVQKFTYFATSLASSTCELPENIFIELEDIAT